VRGVGSEGIGVVGHVYARGENGKGLRTLVAEGRKEGAKKDHTDTHGHTRVYLCVSRTRRVGDWIG
jgi:hypothetical protein